MNIYELYGHRAEEFEELSVGYLSTLQLLRDLKSGDTELKDLVITDQGWSIEQEQENVETTDN